MYRFQKDKYQKVRGGHSRILDISCEHCGKHLAYYQKDGPGLLKRTYIDRFIDINPSDKEWSCKSCGRTIGIKINYKKENRMAYRLFIGSVKKKIVSKDILK